MEGEKKGRKEGRKGKGESSKVVRFALVYTINKDMEGEGRRDEIRPTKRAGEKGDGRESGRKGERKGRRKENEREGE